MRRVIKSLTWVTIWLSWFHRQSECYFKFPGAVKHDIKPKEEDDIFNEAMNKMLQPGELCNTADNDSFLKEIEDILKQPISVKEIQEKLLEKKNICRYDLTSCNQKCECNVNAAFDKEAKVCRVRIGWPCTDGEAAKPNQCVSYASCKPWEGSYSYDTEEFPPVSSFLTDAGKYWCRCNDPNDPECGGAGDAIDKVPAGKGDAVSIPLPSTFFLTFSPPWILWLSFHYHIELN
ncbi:unnamed protein product [Allacma fusca]|uniref:Uncharacterized protein n=1 Tax=Allacma fusca TaxID=39272 RepID=A0A8J2Q0P9_9HEXA|nr:unnamed protein product [Allacma fusca]